MSKARTGASYGLDQSPAMKTRRINAVHSRRLALHVSLLERHLAALETQQVRAIREVHEELRQLKSTPFSLLPVSTQRTGNVTRENREQPIGVPVLGDASTDHVRMPQTGSPKQINLPTGANVLRLGSLSHLAQGPLSGSDMVNAWLDKHDLKNHTLSFEKTVKCQSDLNRLALVKPCNEDGLPLQRPSFGNPEKHAAAHSHLSFDGKEVNNEHGACAGKTAPNKGDGSRPAKQEHNETRQPELQNRTGAVTILDVENEGRPVKGLENFNAGHVGTLHEVDSSMPADSSSPSRSHTRLHVLPVIAAENAFGGATISSLPSQSGMYHMAGQANGLCRHFPCTKPSTYHSLGFHPDPSPRSWQGWKAQNARRPRRLLTSAQPSRLAEWNARRTTEKDPGYRKRRRLEREELLRMDMARKKEAHALTRPPPWNTNYGQPTPFKRLNYPARLKPLV